VQDPSLTDINCAGGLESADKRNGDAGEPDARPAGLSSMTFAEDFFYDQLLGAIFRLSGSNDAGSISPFVWQSEAR